MFSHGLSVAGFFAVASLSVAEPDVIADFEGPGYGDWLASGTAFGTAPAKGALPRQGRVEGFLGQGLASSFHGGDAATGRLTSPPFKIDRKFITFLIGGGGWIDQTCLNLVVDGSVVRTATGPNVKPGGNESMASASWDVSEFAGREARLEIVDDRKTGWGHLNVDQIVLTDDRGDAALVPPRAVRSEVVRRLKIDGNFLQLPLKRRTEGKQAGVERFTIEEGGKVRRFIHLEIVAKDEKPDFMYSYDVREFRGREVTFRFKSDDADVLHRLELSDREIIDPQAYAGAHRPRFHFSPRIGWMNDINGPYWQDGLYHLFYQANPTVMGHSSGFDMHWGHSISRDLVHWEEWPLALFPGEGGNCFSGSAVLLSQRIPGVNDDAPLPTPALFFTAAATPRGQHLATSADGGRTWRRFPGNPALPQLNRDPKVFWHEPSGHYVILIYMNPDGDQPEGYTIYRSRDLTRWEKTGHIPGWNECPEFLPMKSAVTGKEVWLLYGCWRESPEKKPREAAYPSAYQFGEFDGKTFKPFSKVRPAHLGPQFYGALTFQNEPKGRPVMMGWARGTRFPGESFSQCASVPLMMQPRAVNGEDVLCFEPVEELDALRGEPLLRLNNVTPAVARDKLAALAKDASLDVVLRFRPRADGSVSITIRACEFRFQPSTGRLALTQEAKPLPDAVIHPEKEVTARFLIDRGIVESFWNHGEAAYSMRSLSTDDGPAFSVDGEAKIEELVVYPVADIWAKK